MDAGLAAVCGALAGSVATIGAALATGWSQREGARIAARSAYAKEQRQPRHDAYRSLMQNATEVADTSIEGVDNETMLLVSEKLATVEEAWLEISLLGPPAVLRRASQVRRECSQLSHKVSSAAATGALPGADIETTDPNTPYAHYVAKLEEIDQLAMELAITIDVFAEVAQAAIENDGSERLRR
ncbi:hypothetical protein ACFV0W_01890 [Streptomyces anulatus]